MVRPEPGAGDPADVLSGRRGHLERLPHYRRRDSGLVRRASGDSHRLSGAGPADCRGPGHLSAHDGHARGPVRECRSGLQHVWHELRLCHLQGRHRPVLGAEPGARAAELGGEQAAARGQPPARAGRDRGRLGVRVCAGDGQVLSLAPGRCMARPGDGQVVCGARAGAAGGARASGASPGVHRRAGGLHRSAGGSELQGSAGRGARRARTAAARADRPHL